MKIKGKAYTCELSAASGVRFTSDLPIPEDTAVYAVKRFISHSPVLRRICTHRSYRLRLGGKAPRKRILVFEAPAYLLELPGTTVRAALQITQKGAAITSINLKFSGKDAAFRIVA